MPQWNGKLRFLSRLADFADAISDWSGRAVAWLVPGLALITVYDIFMRYFLHRGSVFLQELEWHFFALIFLLGAAHTLRCGEHVRMDLVYRRLGEKARAWINLLGGTLFLVPFCLLVISSSWEFVVNSFQHGEHSPDPGGLPYRWLLKAAIPVGFALLLLQGLADMLRSLRCLLQPEQK